MRHKFRISMIALIVVLLGVTWWWYRGVPGLNDGQPGQCLTGACFMAGEQV